MSDIAYATFAQYSARNAVDTADQSRVEEQLLAVSRHLDNKLRMMPGGFAPIASATFYFDGTGTERLWLRDAEGRVYPLRTVIADGIRPDFDRTGDYGTTTYAWDFDKPFIWPIPRNGAATGRPYRALELRRVGAVPIAIWPYADGSVRIQGAWGWAATPPDLTELVIKLARDISDSHRGGAAATIGPMEDAIGLQDDTWRLWLRVENEYSYGRLADLGVV